jgi:hypothetical protein
METGLILLSGEVRPVARTEFLLCDRDPEQLLRESDFASSLPPRVRDSSRKLDDGRPGDILTIFAPLAPYATGRYPGGDPRALLMVAKAFQRGLQAIRQHAIAATTTDFAGRATFPQIPPGNYYIFGYTNIDKAGAVWSVPVEVRDATAAHIILDNSNSVHS